MKKYSTLGLNEIESRLANLEEEKSVLLTIREELLKNQAKQSPPLNLSTHEKVQIFKRLFRGQESVYANRWANAAGRSGYAVACNNDWKPGICGKPKIKCGDCPNKAYKPLNDHAIYNHLSGKETIGVYPLLHDNHCWFLAADFDKADWQDAIRAMRQVCQQYNIPIAVERSRSGNGAHLWIFFAEKVPAINARKLGVALLDRAMEIYSKLSFESYDRLFPNQDTLPSGGFGNLIALPLQWQPRQHGNSVYIDENFIPINDQWQFLSQIAPLSLTELNELNERFDQDIIEGGDNNTITPTQSIAPWEQSLPIKNTKIEGCPSKVSLVLANQIYLPVNSLPSALVTRLKRLASFANPKFFKAQAMRFSTYNIPRYICCARIEKNYLCLPRGCIDDIISQLSAQNIQPEIDDRRHQGTQLENLHFKGKLRDEQQNAVNKIIQQDFGVLHAPTAFGKTVTAISIIANRKVNTLILVHSRQLLDQWKERLSVFLEDVKIGVMGGGKRRATGEIDIATYQSLISKKDNEIDPKILEYGQVIVDECHHVPAPRFELLLSEVRSKYVLGVTATPDRQDGHQKIIFMQTGPVRHKVKEQNSQNFQQTVKLKQFYSTPPKHFSITGSRPHISDIYHWLMNHESRNKLIISDILQALIENRTPLVLTERRDHALILSDMLTNSELNIQVLRGAMKAKDRREALANLEQADVIIATGKYLGEGFDLPKLDTLFLALPISWKGTLSQYAGRIHRQSDSKKEVIIYDYVDTSLPMLQKMFERRSKGYNAMGYKLTNSGATTIPQTHLIFATEK